MSVSIDKICEGGNVNLTTKLAIADYIRTGSQNAFIYLKGDVDIELLCNITGLRTLFEEIKVDTLLELDIYVQDNMKKDT